MSSTRSALLLPSVLGAALLVGACSATPRTARDAHPRTSTLDDERWWGGTRNGVGTDQLDVDFVPPGDHPWMAIFVNGVFYTSVGDDSGSRVEKDGRVHDRAGSAEGRVGTDGILHDSKGAVTARIEAGGAIVCGGKPGGRLEGHVLRDLGGKVVGELHGDWDWRQNPRAGFLLLTIGCLISTTSGTKP